MLPEQLKEKIIAYVNKHPGCTAVELVVGVTNPDLYSVDMPKAIGELVDSGSLCEVEYALPHMKYRCKSVFFSATSSLELRKEATSIKLFSGGKEVKSFPHGTEIVVIKETK